jgi:hypothetical protein
MIRHYIVHQIRCRFGIHLSNDTLMHLFHMNNGQTVY